MFHTFNSMFALFCPFIFFGLNREVLATDRAIFVFISEFSENQKTLKKRVIPLSAEILAAQVE
jgi:hypothetical protein